MEKMQVWVYQCPKCKKYYQDEYVASICCKEYHCEICSVPTERYYLKCESCQEKARFDRATKMTPEEYYEKYPDYMVYDGSDFYSDTDELISHYLDNELELPTYCYGTFKVFGEIEADNILVEIEENINCEDLVFDKEAYKEFREFATKFNEKHKIYCFHMDDDIIVLLGVGNEL